MLSGPEIRSWLTPTTKCGGDQKRNDLTKALGLAKKTLQNRKSLLKAFSGTNAELDVKVKAVNDAVSAKAQANFQAAQDAARAQAAARAFSNTGGDIVLLRLGGNGYRTSSRNGSRNHHTPDEGNTSAPKGGNCGHPTWAGTTGSTPGIAHWEGNDLYVDTKFQYFLD